MRRLLFIPLMVLSGFVPGKTSSFLNPTGTYILKGKVKNNRVTGHSGELRVRLLDDHKIALWGEGWVMGAGTQAGVDK